MWRDQCTNKTPRAIACIMAVVVVSAASPGASREPTVTPAEPVPAGEVASDCDSALSELYAHSAWPAVHRDLANSDFTPFATADPGRVLWTALDGAAVLAHPTIGPERNVYVVTGQGPGTSHLHAFDRDGQLLWETAPQQTQADLDSGAAYSAPVIDMDGDVYLADYDQFWAFHSDGSTKWVEELPSPGSMIPSAVITTEGYVGGITTDGKIYLRHREDGAAAVPVFDLPGGHGPAGGVLPPGLWEGGLLDPAMIQVSYDITLGFNVEVANSPAIDADTGRMFITAAGATPEQGVLYGLDIVNGVIQIAFERPIGGGSGSSPAISRDGTQVFAVGGDGVMISFDVTTGDEMWRRAEVGSATSPAVGDDGTIYTGGGTYLYAIDPVDGSIKWSKNYDALARAMLPRERFLLLPFSRGIPVARTSGVVSLSTNRVLVSLNVGYELQVPGAAEPLVQPRKVVIASIDPADGQVRDFVTVRDTCDGTIAVGDDGRIYVRHGVILGSIFYYGVNELLPQRYGIPGPPVAGLTVLAPSSFADQVTAGLEQLIRLCDASIDAMEAGNAEEAAAHFCMASGQLDATELSIGTDASDELTSTEIIEALQGIGASRLRLLEAEALLSTDVDGAIELMQVVRDTIQSLLSTLHRSPTVTVDVMPDVCPNAPFDRRIPLGTIDVAIIGSAEFDPQLIELNTLRLSRTHGGAGEVAPVLRRGVIRAVVADVGTTVDRTMCSCEEQEPDGIDDLIVSFSALDVYRAFGVRKLAPDTQIEVRLTGNTRNGTAFEAEDCMTIR